MDSPFVGQIQSFAFNFAPRGWALCQGQLMSISQNTALFSLLGTNYGGNGVQTFGLPDLRGRVPVGQGQGPGLSSYITGEIGGAENVSILIGNMPSHTHTATFTPGGGSGGVTGSLKASTMTGTQSTPGTSGATTLAAGNTTDSSLQVDPCLNYVADANPTVALTGLTISLTVGGGTVTNAVTGSSLPLNTLSPFLCINYSISLSGIFPSRN